MSEPSGWQALEARGRGEDEEVASALLAWGRLVEQLLAALSPLGRVEDLLQLDSPWGQQSGPLGDLVASLGTSDSGREFLGWWLGRESALPSPEQLRKSGTAGSVAPETRARLVALRSGVERAFRTWLRTWEIHGERVVGKGERAPHSFRVAWEPEVWALLGPLLPSREADAPLAPTLDQAIARVRAFFEPLESPLFGMSAELLAHHVRETIPREVPGDIVPPIIPLFGKHQPQSFSASASLPTHLRVVLRRWERAQAQGEVVAGLLALLEAVDFSLRFATGLAQGCCAAIDGHEASGSFDPPTGEIIAELSRSARRLRQSWDHSHAQPALHLLYRGAQWHPFLEWAGFDSELRLLPWMLEVEEAIREDNPARCLALTDEVQELFHEWLAEFVLLGSAWDVVIHTRQDGYLGVTVGRGPVGVMCKPLVDPTRYSVWLDRSELAAINKAFLPGRSSERLEPLDPRIMRFSNDPPTLSDHIAELLRAQDEGQVLRLGRSIFHGLEYLVRLHASLAGGFLRHRFEESSLLDPVLKAGGSLQHTVYFLAYAQRVLGELDDPSARLLRSVFFAEGQGPRAVTKWLGIDEGVPGPLQGMIGWNLSLMRPDAANRLDEIRDQLPKFSSLFADLVETSRQFWARARLHIEPGAEGAEATVCQFPDGLRVRGVPDIRVGHRLFESPRSVVIGGAASPDLFSHWEVEEATESAEFPSAEREPREEVWPSLFDDPAPVREPWPAEAKAELELRCQEWCFTGPEGRPSALAQEIAAFIAEVPPHSSTLSLVRGPRGGGRTFLCRTLTHPELSPLPKDFPVLYLRVDRFPETRLSTVVERLNDHVASESSLDRFGWSPVPTETLQSLGSEVDRLARDLADLGHHCESLTCRLSSYLRYLKKLNGGRDFLLILDGLESVPPSLLPRVLGPGIHLLITGSDFPPRLETSPYLLQQVWDLSQEFTSRATFALQLSECGLDPARQSALFHRFGGSLLKARAFNNLCEQHENQTPSPAVLEELLSYARRLFPEPGRREAFQELVILLGLYERPVPLRILESLGVDIEVANMVTSTYPSLFSFWAQPEPSLGLAHREIFELLSDASGAVEAVAQRLTREFLASPKRSEVMPALRWLSFSGAQAELMEQFFAQEEAASLWREELARLWKERLYFHRVALLDASEEPLLAAIESGAGHLREELGWLHNARGLSLLQLGLVDEACRDLEIALDRFQVQFADGETEMIASIGSATNRLSEAALKSHDLGRARRLSETALTVLQEWESVGPSHSLRGLMAMAWLHQAQIALREGDFSAALAASESAHELLLELEPEKFAVARGEAGWFRAEALAGLGKGDLALRELQDSVDRLFQAGAVESGVQALLLRARLHQGLGENEAAHSDLERAMHVLRYRVFAGRLDLEPLLAYTAARRALTGGGRPVDEARALQEFLEWGRHAIRFEGRSDLRALVAYLYLARGHCWKEAGQFVRAVDDLRSATEQYDLLSLAVSKADSEVVWSGLRSAFAQMAGLYVSLDEAPLAILAGRRALDLAQRSRRQRAGLESGLEVPEFSLVAPKETRPAGELETDRLYQTARLYFHLGEATRRLNLEKFATAYFEQSASGYERLLAEPCPLASVRLEEYRVVLKYVARGAEARRDYRSLEHWVVKMADLPESLLSKADHFSLYSWKGACLTHHGDLLGAQVEFRAALESLDDLKNHPRYLALRAETLLRLGRVLSLQGDHPASLRCLEEADALCQDALFEEGEEHRELLIRSALHQAVASLRAGHQEQALDRLRILASFRPLGAIAELEQLTDDWVTAWQGSSPLELDELLRRLLQMCELGDWLLRTPLGFWFRELVTELVTHHGFVKLVWESEKLDQVIETFLVVSFSQTAAEHSGPGFRGASVSDTGELQRLLKAKFRSLEQQGRLVEAELALSHMLPARSSPTSGRLLLTRSEMALRRGDRGVGIVDLLRATEARGRAKVKAHLRLAEFLLSRDLQAAASLHLRRCLFSIEEHYGEVWPLLDQVGSLMTGLVRAGAQLDSALLEEYLRVCHRGLPARQPVLLDAAWLKALGDYRDWPQLLELLLQLVGRRQEKRSDLPGEWRFLEEVLERTLLCVGRLSPVLLKELGKMLVTAGIEGKADVWPHQEALWERFVGLLPSLGRREAFALMQRLFEFASGKGVASAEGRSAAFLARLEEEQRLLGQPI